MEKFRKTARISSYFLAVAIVSACSEGGGKEGAEQGAFGFLSLGISDGPIHSAEKVCITFDYIELKGPGGAATLINLSPAEKINLLDFQGANAMPVLTQERLPAGRYNWLRLGVDAVRGSSGGAGDTGGELCDGEASYIVMDDGSVYNLYVPSGDQSGLKLNGGYTVPANDTVSLTAEFDLARSITAPPGQSPDMKLKPTIKLVDNNEVGTLTGTVSNDLASAENCEPSVYLFADGVMPNAIVDDEDDPNDPVATAIVESEDNTDGSVTWSYTIGFLLTGNYEAAFTCNGTDFSPAEGHAAAISSGNTTVVDF